MGYGMQGGPLEGPYAAVCVSSPDSITANLSETQREQLLLGQERPSVEDSRELMSVSSLGRKTAFCLQCHPVPFCPALSPQQTKPEHP